MSLYRPNNSSKFNANIPHAVIGKSESYNSEKPLFNRKEKELVENLRKWGLILIVALIIIYAVYRIFFG